MAAALSISPALPSDVPSLAQIQRAAFLGSRIQQLIFGRVLPSDGLASSSARLLKAIQDPEQAVCKAEKGGEIVGMALWGLPKEWKEEEKEKEEEEKETEEQRKERIRKRFPLGADYELADSFFGSLDLGIRNPHYHLEILVISPTHQRTGAGMALLRWGCTQADKEGLDTYLEASDVGVGLYEKAGFKPFREPIVGGPDGSMILYPMHRPPLLLTPALPSHLSTIATIHRTAFASTAWFQALWGQSSPSAFDAWFLAKARGWLENEGASGKDHLLVARRGEEVLGYALWEEKEGPGAEEADYSELEGKGKEEWPEGTNVQVAEQFNKDMLAYTSSISGRYWHLHFLATSPLHQRSGAGKSLIRWGIARAQEDSLPAYLEGGLEALPLYLSLGFTPCSTPITSGGGSPNHSSFADQPLVLHPLLILPASQADVPSMASLHRRAFHGAPHKLVIFPNVQDADYQAWNEARMLSWLAPQHQGKHHTVVAKRGGVVLGFAHYVVAEHGEEEGEGEGEGEMPPLPEGADEEKMRYLYKVLGESEGRVRGRYVMLHQLATDPSYQRTGAGRALLKWGIELTQGKGLDLYLDATPPGRPLYDSMGFKQWAPNLSAWGGSVESYPMSLPHPLTPSSTISPLPLGLELTPASLGEVPHLAALFRQAFAPTKIYQAMFHSCPSASYDAWNEVRYKRWLANEAAEGGRRKHWTLVARRGEQVVGFAHWEVHPGAGAEEEEEEEEEKLELPEGTDKEKGPRIFDALHAASEGIEGRFVMLHQLAISPSLQRTGAGRALTQACIDFCQEQEEQGLDLYLDSTELGKPMYDKMGFVQWDQTTSVGEGWPKTFPMVYRATKST